MRKYKQQIIMVSGQMIPNVTPVLDEAIRPEKVILCASNAMEDRACFLASYFNSKKIETEIYSLGYAYNFAELQERFLELAARFDPTDSVAVNLTGGNKLITISAQMVFDEFPCFYVIPEKDQIIMLDLKLPSIYEIEDKISLRDYFAIHGFTVTKQDRKRKVALKTVDLCEKLLKLGHTYNSAFSKLNAVATAAEKMDKKLRRPCLGVSDYFQDDVCEVIHHFNHYGYILNGWNDKKIEFASADARDFCKGFWLEDYVCAELAKVDAAIGLQDWAASIHIENASGSKNEIDAAFLYNNELYVIECKTARMDQKGSDVLYKLDTIRGYAGLYTKSLIASFKELEPHDRQRAADLKITLIEGKNLNRFAERIKDILNPANGENR